MNKQIGESKPGLEGTLSDYGRNQRYRIGYGTTLCR